VRSRSVITSRARADQHHYCFRQPCRRHRHGWQIRAGLVPLGCVDDFRVDWQWIPAWRPADITDSGREQLRAIGFTI
jgi:hypothetical protein